MTGECMRYDCRKIVTFQRGKGTFCSDDCRKIEYRNRRLGMEKKDINIIRGIGPELLERGKIHYKGYIEL